MRRSAARWIVVLALAGPAVVLRASPCSACACVSRPPDRLLGRADAAFVGSVVAQQPLDQTTTVQTFAVRSIYKGELGATVDVLDPIGSGGGSTCGILYGPGPVAVLLHRQGDGWTTDACSRISIADLERVGPAPIHPTPIGTGSLGPGPSLPGGGAGSGGVGWRTAVVGFLAGVAAIAGAIWFGTRRDRARPGVKPGSASVGAPNDGPPDPGSNG